MPRFGRGSQSQLATAHVLLQRLFQRVVLDYDCVVIEGHRGEQAQNRAFASGASKLKFPNGNHNAYPSNAVDVAPYDVDLKSVNWTTKVLESFINAQGQTDHRVNHEALANYARFYHFAGLVKGMALLMGITIRWGGDWDGDNYFTDQTFNDLVHFELVPARDVYVPPQVIPPANADGSPGRKP